jgi:hypothetical protein
MKKMILIVGLLGMFLLAGCAGQTWQVKTVNSTVGASYGLIVAQGTVQPPCDKGTISVENCNMLKTRYNLAVTAYKAAVNDLKLALVVTDAVQQDTLLQQMEVILAQFKLATQNMIDLIQEIQAAQTNTTLPKPPLKLSPAVIDLILSAINALIKIAPDIVAWVNGWVASVDTATLLKQLDAAVAAIPVWK